MKKILFLILFLTGITPVFKNNTLNLVCYQSYGQEDPWGEELEDVIICNEPDQVTIDDYGSYTITETCVWSNINGIDTNDCEWNCSTVHTETPDNGDGSGGEGSGGGGSGGGGSGGGGSGSPCGNQVICPTGQQLNTTTCQCECTKTCPSGYWLSLLSCDCVKETPCTTVCPIGFDLIDCQCRVNPCLNSDLRHKEVADNVMNIINQRTQTAIDQNGYVKIVNSFGIQKIEDGHGDINLDRYSLEIKKLPNNYTPQMLFEEIRTNFSDFVTGGDYLVTEVDLMPYSPSDGTTWNSSNPVGAAMDFDNFMDTSTVICTEYSYNEMYWTFTTVRSQDHMGHFVSGHRQFGIKTNSNGSYSFYLRGADRLGQAMDEAANNWIPGVDDVLFNNAADKTWKNLMSNLEKFIKAKTGSEVNPFNKDKVYGERFEYNEEDCPNNN